MAMICWYIIVGTILQCSTPMPAKTAPNIFLDAQNDYKENAIEQHDSLYDPDRYAGLTAPFLVNDTDKMWQTALAANQAINHYEQHISSNPEKPNQNDQIIIRNAN